MYVFVIYIYIYTYICYIYIWCTTSQLAAIQLLLQLENIRRTIIIRRNYLHYIKRLAAKFCKGNCWGLWCADSFL